MSDDVVAQIGQLIRGEPTDDGQPSSAAADTHTDEHAHSESLRGDDSGHEPVDVAQPQPVSTVEANTEGEPDEVATDDGEPVTVKRLAEQLGVEPKALYDELVIPSGGEQFTLSELADLAPKAKEFEQQREAFTVEREDFERSQLKLNSEVNRILEGMSPDELNQRVAHSREQIKAYESEQRELTLRHIPEWEDSDTLARERKGIIALGADYGFSQPEMEVTHDHRTLRMLRDMHVLRERVKGMEERAEKVAVTPNAKAKPRKVSKQGQLAKMMSNAKASQHPGDKIAAVSALITGR